jgi:FkbM family methyltransferase
MEYCTEGAAEFSKQLFPEEFKGICIDIGAHHSQWKNNTWIFEQDGWDTYCIEPNIYCIDELKANRKKVYHCAIGNKNDNNSKLFIYGKVNKMEGPNGMAAGTGLNEWYGIADEIQNIKALTLEKFCEEQNISRIDYLSIDTEGTEVDIITSTDLRKLNVKILVIENVNLLSHRKQKEYLNSQGFHWVKRFIYNDVYIGGNLREDKGLYPENP